MKTTLWGPSAWTFLHAVSFSYPEDPSPEHKEAALNLFSSLQLLLPCGDCCSHYCSTFQRKDLFEHLESRESFSRWLVTFHNLVNRRLKKPEYSYDVAKAFYLNDEATCAIQSPCGEDHITQTQESQSSGQPLFQKLLVPESSALVPKFSTQSPLLLGSVCVALLLFLFYIFRNKK
jgi:hypothetical protein